MKKLFLLVFLLIFTSFSIKAEKVGLVLSGGGAKGAVHIGIIKALEENDIPIDYISGTSIGAIVGSLYAMGYTPDEMLALFSSEEFLYWQSGKVEDAYKYYFRKEKETPEFMRINIPLKDSLHFNASIFSNSLVNPIQMNQAFLQLFAQATAQCQGNFDNLFVPFLCVAADIYNKESVVFRSGDLGDAVRASMSFPFVFKPTIKDDIPLYDGGIYDNFPIHPTTQAWNPDFLIGSSLAGNSKKKPLEQNLYEQLSDMVMQKTEYNIPSEKGVMFRFNLEDVGLLDFNRAEELYKLGYDRTIEMLDSIKGRVKDRRPLADVMAKRERYKASLPPLVFKNIYITGTNDAQRIYIENQIKSDDKEVFTFEDFKKTYFNLLTNHKIKEIMPHSQFDPESNTFNLYLDIQIRDDIGIAFGGNVSSLNANQIYLGLTYNSLTEISSTFNLDLQLGNAYTGVGLEGRVELPKEIPFDVSGIFAYNYRSYYETEKLFIDTEVATFIKQRELFGKLALGLPFLNKAKVEIFAGYGELDDRYYQHHQGSYVGQEFDQSKYLLFNGGVYYNKNSFDAKQYPIKGQNHQLYAQFIYGEERFKPAGNKTNQQKLKQSYIQMNASIYNLYDINDNFNLGYLVEGVFSSKNPWSNFTASVLQAPAFTPTPHSVLVFNEAFRANQYFAGGIIPIWKINNTFHIRGDFYGFLPIFPFKRGEEDKSMIYYGDPFSRHAYMGELSIVARLPFMNISLFGNYYSYPKNNWNFGLNLGYLIFGHKFIK